MGAIFTWGDVVEVRDSAPDQFMPGRLGSVCGFRDATERDRDRTPEVAVGMVLYTVEFGDGYEEEIPEVYLVKAPHEAVRGELLAEFHANAQGATSDEIVEAEQKLGLKLPADYLEFMRKHDGGEGSVGLRGFVVLWRVSELASSNEGYSAKEAYPGHVLIGSNGGGEAIAIREGNQGPEYVLMPFIGDLDDALLGGHTLMVFLERFGSGAIWKR